MARFSSPQDPLFQRINSSISFDYRLAPYDLEQSGAHARMLASRDIISAEDLAEIERGLAAIRREIDEDTFAIQPGDEDVHMAIERRLIELVGPVGGKLHTARSRNDQVATALRLHVRDQAGRTLGELSNLVTELAERATDEREVVMPAYTHRQRAQPITAGFLIAAVIRTSSAPSRSTSRTTCSPTSGSSAAMSIGSTSA